MAMVWKENHHDSDVYGLKKNVGNERLTQLETPFFQVNPSSSLFVRRFPLLNNINRRLPSLQKNNQYVQNYIKQLQSGLYIYDWAGVIMDYISM
jgi:hypothetical protein